MLSPQQLAARENKLTASRIACLMTGDAEKIMQLYREMIGEAEPENLDRIWAVRLGQVTEQLQLDWYEEQSGTPVTRRGEVVVHPLYDWAACTLDGWDSILEAPIECKHVGGREPIEVIIDRYQPQCQWQCEVTGASQFCLSIITGANAPILEYVDFDPDYAVEMVLRGKQFMRCVRDRTPPVILPPVPPPVDAAKIYDMSENQEWRKHASIWLQCYGAAKTQKDTEQVMKAMVPDDAKKAFGAGVRITRDRAGRLSQRKDNE